MSRCALALVVATFSLRAAAQDPDSFCMDIVNPLNLGNPAPWIIDQHVNTRVNFGLSNVSLTDADIENSVDRSLQHIVRASRGSLKARVLYGGVECSLQDGDLRPCIEAYNNDEDPDQCKAGGFLGLTVCNAFGCNIKICQDNGWDGAWEDGRWQKVITHELGHTMDLDHVDAGGAGCAGARCSGSTCAGELMCTSVGCLGSSFLTYGDARGIRASAPANPIYGPLNYPAYSRRLYWGSDAVSDGLQVPVRAAALSSTANTFYNPRISCSLSTSPTNQCAAVYAESLSQIRIARLSSPSAGGGWDTEVVVRTLGATASLAPDIAINPSGTVAYVVHANAAQNIVVTRVPLDGSATSVVTLGTGFRPVLPPRIDFVDGAARVLILDDRGAGLRTLPPTFRLFAVSDGAGAPPTLGVTQVFIVPASGSAVDIDSTVSGAWTDTHTIVGDYDFACRQLLDIGRCTIVALFTHDDPGGVRVTRPRSIRLTVDGTSTTASTVDADWAAELDDAANAILGASVDSLGRLAVAWSKPITSGTQTANTKVVRFATESVAGTVLSESEHRGDAQTCSTMSANGESFGAASMHGGYSISYCRSCGGTDGTLESAQWGNRSDGNTQCY